MRIVLALLPLAALAACGGVGSSSETYTCPNGPDLGVTYSDGQAQIAFPDGRVETLPLVDPERPDFYARPGMSWDAGEFRTARLDDGQRSLRCDQMS